jgi:hypothetical protein
VLEKGMKQNCAILRKVQGARMGAQPQAHASPGFTITEILPAYRQFFSYLSCGWFYPLDGGGRDLPRKFLASNIMITKYNLLV